MEGFGLHTTLFEEDTYNNLKAPLDRNDRIAPCINADDNVIERQDVILPAPPRKSVFQRLREWISKKRKEKAERSREKQIAQLKMDLIEAKKKMGRIERMIYFAGKKDFQ
ncbi:hypothetical protein PRIPAC_97321 [Pristionchus pacificus]|uniref:Uncharacterized protein n=1 Tax=Pristionchus pacificus TaxID=54126 RepID=A0A454Y2P6_PRIPA|nr:hypothetical protein PRIPAC_97321 [Pristionchus pacificus]|eukprot:PDM81666.1 hypothetical protein PRIPAC_30647 [Pristionchus pacificus]